MSSSHGFFGILLIIIIMITGITAGIYLLLQRTNFLPEAALRYKDASFSIKPYDPKFPITQSKDSFIFVPPDGNFTVNVLITTGDQPISSLSTQILYPKQILKVTSIDATSLGAIPLNWIDQYFDNDKGIIVLSANAYSDGFKSPPDQTPLLARINFQVQPNIAGKIDKIDFSEDKTFMVRRADDSAVKNLVKHPLEVRVSLLSQ